MSKRESIARYSLIINKLRKKPSTFSEIADYLERESELQGYNYNVSQRTFQRDLEDIDSLYSIEIKYDFSQKVYRIVTDNGPEIYDRMLEAFDMFNALNLNERVRNFIHFEKRRPQGTENMYGLLHAIENRLRIKFTHKKFWDQEATQRIAEPYALKEYRSRWYLIAKDCGDDKIKSFALDRLSDPEFYRQKFRVPSDFDVEEMYRYCFGIVSPNAEVPQNIVLSFDPFQGKYIRSLPLHHTQEILQDDSTEFRIQLKLCITHELVMELLSFGETVKVLKPKRLVDEMKGILRQALASYDL